MTANEVMTLDLDLGVGAFAHDLLRAEDLVDAYAVTRPVAVDFLIRHGAVRLPRYTGGLDRTGVPPIRMWAIRRPDDWLSKGAKVRTQAYLEQGAAA